MCQRVQCRSWDEAETHLTALSARDAQLATRLRTLEKQIDTLGSPWWKRALFRLDGWPPWYVVGQRRAWRPWHRRDRRDGGHARDIECRIEQWRAVYAPRRPASNRR